MDTSAGSAGSGGGSSTNCQLAIDGFTEHMNTTTRTAAPASAATTAAAAFDSKHKIIRPPVRSMSVMIESTC